MELVNYIFASIFSMMFIVVAVIFRITVLGKKRISWKDGAIVFVTTFFIGCMYGIAYGLSQVFKVTTCLPV